MTHFLSNLFSIFFFFRETESVSSPEVSANNTQQTKKSKQDPAQQQTKIKSGMNKETNIKEIPATKAWHETPFLLNSLEAHNDIVCCVDLDEDYIISGRYRHYKVKKYPSKNINIIFYK